MVKQKVEKYRKPSIAFQVLGIILASIFILASGMLIWVASCDAGAGEVPDVFGWSACSSNGEYEGVQRDALVLVNLSYGGVNYEQGNVVAFYYPNATTSTKIYLGSISAIEDGQASLYINEKLPELYVDQGLILGRAEYYIADVGYFLAILEGGYGLVLAISILVLFVAILIMFIGNIALKRRYALEDAQLDAELDVQEEILEKRREEAANFDYRPEDPQQKGEGEGELEATAFVGKADESFAQGQKKSTEAQVFAGEMQTKVSGNATDSLAHISIDADRQQAELLERLLRLAMQQKQVENAEISLGEGDPCTLSVSCDWKDMPIVSAILAEVQKRKETK